MRNQKPNCKLVGKWVLHLENYDAWWQLPTLSHVSYHKLVVSTLRVLKKTKYKVLPLLSQPSLPMTIDWTK